MRIMILAIVFFMVQLRGAGKTSSHTITVRVVKANQISVVNSDPAQISWQSDSAPKKITFLESTFAEEETGLNRFPLETSLVSMDKAMHSESARDFIQTGSKTSGMFRLNEKYFLKKQAIRPSRLRKIIYTITEI